MTSGRLLLLLVPLTCQTVAAQQTFEQFKKEQQRGKVAQQEAFAEYKAEVTAKYERFKLDHERAFEEYKRNIVGAWGGKNVQTSTNKQWVGYDRDFQGRRRVDFEKGEARVEVLIDPKKAADPEYVHQELSKELQRLLTERGSDDPLESREKTPALSSPILAGQVMTRLGKPVNSENAPAFIEDVLALGPPQTEDVTGGSGGKRVAVSVQFPLIPDHVRVRAEQFRETVQKQSREQQVDAALVFAVIHTESAFNPRARSSAPAYGLMQLVPSAGARAAYNALYGRDELVTAEYLYQPGNNIRLGSAYLHLLLGRDFRDVKDERSRIYCAIAAYNTGPANVAKAFTAKRNIPEAVTVINGMSSDAVYGRLRNSLPYEETRTYVRTVSERLPLYNEWRKND
jgi:membrane-bound lytic murein transglycosylase C